MFKKYLLLFSLVVSLLLTGCSTNSSIAVVPEDTLTALQNYFGVQEISTRTMIIQGVPTWGFNPFNDEFMNTTTGYLIESEGELKLDTGSDSDGSFLLRTKERGQYKPGSVAETGIGLRIPENATGNQYAEWGYFDDYNGFGWGHNSTCYLYTFVLRDEVKDSRCMEDFSVNHNLNIRLEKGNIFTTRFVWYGYGDIEFYLSSTGEVNSKGENIVDLRSTDGAISVIDPNQPISVKVDNSGTAGNFSVFVGGKQMSYYDGFSAANQISVVQSMNDYTLPSAENVWYPVMAMQLKPTFGPSDRPNSMRVEFDKMGISTTEDIQYRVTSSAAVSNTDWRNVSLYDGHSAVRVLLANETTINVTDIGFPFIHKSLTTAKGLDVESVTSSENVVLGSDDVIIFWVNRDSNGVPIIDTHMDWFEQR